MIGGKDCKHKKWDYGSTPNSCFSTSFFPFPFLSFSFLSFPFFRGGGGRARRAPPPRGSAPAVISFFFSLPPLIYHPCLSDTRSHTTITEIRLFLSLIPLSIQSSIFYNRYRDQSLSSTSEYIYTPHLDPTLKLIQPSMWSAFLFVPQYSRFLHTVTYSFSLSLSS